jgi:hypothetical protein
MPPPSPTPIEVKHYSVDPRDLKGLDKNARRMPARQFNQLVANVKADGALTSVPLVHKQNGKLVVLSGNHRVKAAVAAGLEQITVMEALGDNLTPERLVALQLSHNALVGDDDENILRELYDSLDVMSKLASGLTDTDFGGVATLDLTKLAIGAPKYEAVNILFLPEDREVFGGAMESLAKGAAKATRYVGRLADYKQFEAAIVAVQDSTNIHNQALALLVMAELALERLAQMDPDNGDAGSAEAEAAPEPSSA